jgi:hypothetical protein
MIIVSQNFDQNMSQFQYFYLTDMLGALKTALSNTMILENEFIIIQYLMYPICNTVVTVYQLTHSI